LRRHLAPVDLARRIAPAGTPTQPLLSKHAPQAGVGFPYKDVFIADKKGASE
jgi:hypothetical protein